MRSHRRRENRRIQLRVYDCRPRYRSAKRWAMECNVRQEPASGRTGRSDPNLGKDLSKNMVFMIAGGPALSLLLAGAAALVSISIEHEHPFAAHAASAIALSSAYIFAVSAWPMRVGDLETDGKLILSLLRGGIAADRICAS